jgi:hypothetical protein
MCSEACVQAKLSQRRKYAQEQLDKAIEFKLNGHSSRDIEKETGIKKSSQDKIFKEQSIRLNDEQRKVLLGNRWKDHNPIKDGQKQCSKCDLWKPLEAFHKNGNRVTGVVSACKACHGIFYQENQEIIIQRVGVYRKNNPEKIKANGAIYYENNTQQYIENATLWAKNNPEARRAIEKDTLNPIRGKN